MRVVRRLLAVSAAVIVAMTSGALVAQAEDTPSVYTTPGGQISAGRLWNTTCEQYSTNVVRCRAEIWAKTVVYKNGRYVTQQKWVFNNLSYLPAPRATWAGNNLGRTNKDWSSGGRKWRTECDTATTGRGGCRSYIFSDVVKVKPGGGYTMSKEWVFNNLVLFSSSTIPAVIKVPAHILDQSTFSATGIGPIQLGASMKSLKTLGYYKFPGEACGGYEETKVLNNRGIETYDNGSSVRDVLVYQKGAKTAEGAQVGMTLGQIKGLYGAKLTLESKYDQSGDVDISVAVVKSGGNEIVFRFDTDDVSTLKDSDVLGEMVARKYSPYFSYDGC